MRLNVFQIRYKSHIPPINAKIKRADSANLEAMATNKLYCRFTVRQS